MSPPLIIAHRGASTFAPENTLAAFREAAATGADGVELDVHLSKDGVPVVIHDASLRRTSRRDSKVCELTAGELSSLDVGSWFNAKHPKRAKAEFAAEGIPTLAQVLETCSRMPGPIYIELKDGDSDIRELANGVCSMIEGSPILPRVIIKSFRLGVIPIIKMRAPEVQTAALFEPRILDYLRQRKFMIALAREFGADQLSIHYSLATRKLGEAAAAARMPLTVWTVDKPKWIRKCKEMGITALITNDPAGMTSESRD